MNVALSNWAVRNVAPPNPAVPLNVAPSNQAPPLNVAPSNQAPPLNVAPPKSVSGGK